MPFTRPALSQLYTRAKAIINSNLPGADANLQKTVLNIIALVLSEMINGNYGYLDFLTKQPFADTAEAEFLKRLAAIRGINQKPAEKASGNFDVAGNDGAVIDQDLQLQRADGVFYRVTADTTIASGTASVPIEALNVGKIGNADSGTVLTFVSPPVGVNAIGTVDSNGITGGTDIESEDELRQRYLNFIRTPPQGGAKNDYEIWVLQVAGVTKVFVNPLEFGLGTVAVRFLVEPTNSNPNGIPTSGDITRVENYIETKRPVTAKNIAVLAPVPINLNFQIHLLVDDNSDIRAAVEAELRAMLLRDSVPGGTIYISRIIEAISLAQGEYAADLIAPTLDVTNSVGNMSVFGSITFT